MANMIKRFMITGFVALATAQAPPSPVLLTSTKSGVDPIVSTPFNGVETIEGAIIYDGPAVEGFTGPGGNASVQSNLPAAKYTALLPSTNFDNLTGSTIMGSITGSSTQGGQGVMFTVNFTGFPDQAMYGPFVYHIHALPVVGGNCTTSMGHLDPTNRGELHACQVAAPQTCQAGDLAGKHGNVTATSFTASFTDLYLSTDPGSPYFFGDKSIVIHSTNTTRLTCANFAVVSSGMNPMASGTTATPSSMASSTGSSTGSSAGSSMGSSTASGASMSSMAASGAMCSWNSVSVGLVAGISAMAYFLS